MCAFKLKKQYRRRPFKRTAYPSQPVDCYDIKYLDGGSYQFESYHSSSPEGQRYIDVEIREFDVYKNGKWIGKFDNSPRGLVEFAEAMR
jgi:hypothetical protein